MCCKVSKLWSHYANWNKPERKGQTLYYSTTKCPCKSTAKTSRIRVPAVRGVRPVGLGQGPMTAYDGGGGGGRRSIVSDSVSPWTVANQAPLSMEFSRQETAMGGIPFSRRWASGKPPASPGRTLSQMPLPQLSSGQSLSHVWLFPLQMSLDYPGETGQSQ